MSAQSFIFSTWRIANHYDHTTHLPRRDTKNCQTQCPIHTPHSTQATWVAPCRMASHRHPCPQAALMCFAHPPGVNPRKLSWLPTVLGAAKCKVRRRQLIHASSPHLTHLGADCVERSAGFQHIPHHAAQRPHLDCAPGCIQAWMLLLQRHRCPGGCT